MVWVDGWMEVRGKLFLVRDKVGQDLPSTYPAQQNMFSVRCVICAPYIG